MEWLLVGIIFGLITGVFIGANIAPATEITNNIDKIKGNDGGVNVDQSIEQQPTKNKKGWLKCIFTKKDKI